MEGGGGGSCDGVGAGAGVGVSGGGAKLPHSHSTPAGVDGGGARTPPATPKKAGKMLAVRVQMLDDTVTMFQVQAKALGRVLFDQVCKQLHLLEADYFGLEYQDANNTKYWLDLEKPLSRQVGLSLVDPLLRFCVKFYTPDPAQLEEEFTRYLYCLQIKRDLAQGLLQCNDNTAALMASYIVQAECGDYVVEDYPDHTYLSTYKFVPNQDPELERRIMENHKKHAGQSPAEADLNLLETSRRCELYGMKMHPAKDHEGVPLNLAVAHMGIVVFQNFTKINTFSWAKIRKISFKRKRFLIKLHPEGYGYYKDTVEFFFEGRNECKNFWKKCVENHGFFRCSSVKRVPRQKTRVLSRGSSFRYSGRTQKQIVEFVRENYVKRQTFQRSQSFRHSSSVHSSVVNVGTSLSAHPLLPLGDNAVAGTPASLSCGSMTLGSTDPRRRTPSMTATSSPTHTADIHDFDTRDFVIAPTLTPSPPLTTSLSPGTSVTSSPQHFYPRTPGQQNATDDEEQEFVSARQQPHPQSPYRHPNTGQKTANHLLTTASPTQTTFTVRTVHPPSNIPTTSSATNTNINSGELVITHSTGRHEWQRSASCRNLPDDHSSSGRGYYESFYRQERLLDAPITRYDDSRRTCYSAAGSKMGSVDRGPDAVTPDTRIYSSSYPGTTSSLSTESGGGEEPGMIEGGSECILLGTADTGSQEEIVLSHDDLSHDSYELLEREQDEDDDAEDEAELDGITCRSKIKSYAGSRSGSIDSGGDNLPLDESGPDANVRDDSRSPEMFQMDTDDLTANDISVLDKSIVDTVPVKPTFPDTNIVNGKEIGILGVKSDVPTVEIISEIPPKPQLNEEESNIKPDINLDISENVEKTKQFDEIIPINIDTKKELLIDGLSNKDLRENLKNAERQAQTLSVDYHEKYEKELIIDVREKGNLVKDNIHRPPVERMKSDSHEVSKQMANRGKRWALTHQKSIDLTLADSTDFGGDEEENLKNKEIESSDFTIPYVLHKLHPMNGTATSQNGLPVGAVPTSVRPEHDISKQVHSPGQDFSNKTAITNIEDKSKLLEKLSANVSTDSCDEVAIVPTLPSSPETSTSSFSHMPSTTDTSGSLLKQVSSDVQQKTDELNFPTEVVEKEKSFSPALSFDRDFRSEVNSMQEKLVGAILPGRGKLGLMPKPKEVSGSPFAARRAASDVSTQKRESLSSVFVQRRTKSDVARQRDEGDSLVPDLSVEMLEAAHVDFVKSGVSVKKEVVPKQREHTSTGNKSFDSSYKHPRTAARFTDRRAKSDISGEKTSGGALIQRRAKSDISRTETEVQNGILPHSRKFGEGSGFHKEALRTAFAQSHYQPPVSSQDSVASISASIIPKTEKVLHADKLSPNLDKDLGVQEDVVKIIAAQTAQKYEMSRQQAAFIQRRAKSDVSSQPHHPKEAVVRRTKSDVTPRKPEPDQMVPSIDKQSSEEVVDEAIPAMSFQDSFEASFSTSMALGDPVKLGLKQRSESVTTPLFEATIKESDTVPKETVKSSTVLKQEPEIQVKKETEDKGTTSVSGKAKATPIKRQGSSFEELLKGDSSFFDLPDFLATDVRRPIDQGWQRAPALAEAARRSVASAHRRDRSPVLFARARLGWSEGSAVSTKLRSLGSTDSPSSSRRAKSLDAPVVSLHRLPPADSFSSKDDTVDSNGQVDSSKPLNKSASVGSNVPSRPTLLQPQHRSLPPTNTVAISKPSLPPKPDKALVRQTPSTLRTDTKSHKRDRSPQPATKTAGSPVSGKPVSTSGIKLGVSAVSKVSPGVPGKSPNAIQTKQTTAGTNKISSVAQPIKSTTVPKLEPSKAIDIPSPKERLLLLKEKEHAKSESFSSSKSLQSDKLPEYRKAKSLEEKIKEVLEKSPEREILIISPPNADGDGVKRTSPRKLLATKSWSQEKKEASRHKLETSSRSLEVPKTEYGLSPDKERVVPDVLSPEKPARDKRKLLHKEKETNLQSQTSGFFDTSVASELYRHEQKLDIGKSLKKDFSHLMYADGSEESAVESLDEDPGPELWIISDEQNESASVRPIPKEDLVLEFKEAYKLVEKSLESPDVCSDYDNLTPPILRERGSLNVADSNAIPTASFEEYADIELPRSSEEEAKTDQISKTESLDETLKADAVKDLEDTSGDRVVPDVPVSTTDDSGCDEKLGPSEDEKIESAAEEPYRKDEESSESPRDDRNIMERTRSEEEGSTTSSSLAMAPRAEMAAVAHWRPFPLESSGSSSLEDGFFPQDDAAHLADEEETSSTSNNHRDDTFRDDLIDFPSGFGYPCGLAGADMIVGGYGAATFSLSRTLSRISERSTTSEQERSDLEDDSTKPSSHSPSVDDESLLSSDRQPSLSSDPPSGTGGALQSDDAPGKTETPPVPADPTPKNVEAVSSTGTAIESEEKKIPVPQMHKISDEDWPSPPTSSSVFETPVVSHVETFFMEIHPEEACKVTVLDSTDPTGGDESSTDENHTLHDDDDEFMSGLGDECLSSSATTLDGTVKVAVKPKCPSYYCAGSSLSEDTSMGLSLSEWSSSQGTVRPQCQIHYSSAKSDDTSMDDLAGATNSEQNFNKSRIRSPSFYSGAKSDTCLDDTSPNRLSKTPSGTRCQTYYSSKSLTNVDTTVDDMSVPLTSSEKPTKNAQNKCAPHYSTASSSSIDSSVLGERAMSGSIPTVDGNKAQTFLDDTSLSSQSLSERSTSIQTTLVEKGAPASSSVVKIPSRMKTYSYYSTAKSPPSDGDTSSSIDAPKTTERATRAPKRKKSQTKKRHRVTVDLEVRDGHIVEVSSSTQPSADVVKVVEDQKTETHTLSTSTQTTDLKPYVPKQSSV